MHYHRALLCACVCVWPMLSLLLITYDNNNMPQQYQRATPARRQDKYILFAIIKRRFSHSPNVFVHSSARLPWMWTLFIPYTCSNRLAPHHSHWFCVSECVCVPQQYSTMSIEHHHLLTVFSWNTCLTAGIRADEDEVAQRWSHGTAQLAGKFRDVVFLLKRK